jgi:hypothetical protein
VETFAGAEHAVASTATATTRGRLTAAA